MINIKHIIRLYSMGHSQREIVKETGISRSILSRYIKRFKKSGLELKDIDQLADSEAENIFLANKKTLSMEKVLFLYKLYPAIHEKIKSTGMTIRRAWEEYRTEYPDGVSASCFNFHYSKWANRKPPYLKIKHKPGDRLYVDFAGQKLSFIDRQTNKSIAVEVFVTILGASQLTYVQALLSQKKEDFIPACEDALHYYGGVPSAIVTDNLKSAVTKSDRYEPTINETFNDFAEHYETTILPTRAYKPKDKATVEVVIRIIYIRIYSRLSKQVFYSLEELNGAIMVALEDHNNGIIQNKNYSRRQKFEEDEKLKLRPLPNTRYEFRNQSYATVYKHGHVCLSVDRHYYSVPHVFIGEKVKLVYSRKKVYIYHEYHRIATHTRTLFKPYEYTTDPSHLYPAHRYVTELTPENLLAKATNIHKDVYKYLYEIIRQGKHDEQGAKVCLGILTLEKKYGRDRLIKACQRALEFGIYKYAIIKRILEKHLDKQEKDGFEIEIPEHENIRGNKYYE